MGLTGRTQLRKRRYRGWYINRYNAINSKYNLQLTDDEIWNAADAAGYYKACRKKYGGSFWKNPLGYLNYFIKFFPQIFTAALTISASIASGQLWIPLTIINSLCAMINGGAIADQLRKNRHNISDTLNLTKKSYEQAFDVKKDFTNPYDDGDDSPRGRKSPGNNGYPTQRLKNTFLDERLQPYFLKQARGFSDVCNGFKELADQMFFIKGSDYFYKCFYNCIRRRTNPAIKRIQNVINNELIVENYKSKTRLKTINNAIFDKYTKKVNRSENEALNGKDDVEETTADDAAIWNDWTRPQSERAAAYLDFCRETLEDILSNAENLTGTHEKQHGEMSYSESGAGDTITWTTTESEKITITDFFAEFIPNLTADGLTSNSQIIAAYNKIYDYLEDKTLKVEGATTASGSGFSREVWKINVSEIMDDETTWLADKYKTPDSVADFDFDSLEFTPLDLSDSETPEEPK